MINVAIVNGVTKKWGNSIGVIIPKDVVEKEHIKEGQKIEIVIMKPDNVLKETFGMMKGEWKESAQKIKNQLRKELYDD